MPIYEYACEACGHRFEKLMKIGADTPPCDACGAEAAKKLVSASAFVLKGSGWYKDHYGLKKGGGAAKSDSAPAAPATAPAKSEAKPAATPAPAAKKGDA